ncbi:GntR family transcriptional regulator [Fodinisporobacter ferrooxydans]|uniref:GntR family transcriptional regulator n=1 Tax=Fodinisporobacter ferrooxydans TaxID=2901836 RepID=A0ABY4CIU0_9BACL|nr:GntR family transcriptional regulator [Alicyclobacillaceae bacterium MYW30-H2]
MNDQNQWDKDELSPIRDKVYQYIKQAIIDGELKAGERIVERDLSEKLNISRTPIREALFRLESQGFVKTLPRKGVIVSQMSPGEIIEIFTILSVLEGLAVKLAAQRINEGHGSRLDLLISEINQVVSGDNQAEDNEQFHIYIIDTIIKEAGSPKLYEMISSLYDYIRAFANVSHELPGRRQQVLKEHLEIAKAVRNGEIELAESLMKVHIENSKKSYLETYK